MRVLLIVTATNGTATDLYSSAFDQTGLRGMKYCSNRIGWFLYCFVYSNLRDLLLVVTWLWQIHLMHPYLNENFKKYSLKIIKIILDGILKLP